MAITAMADKTVIYNTIYTVSLPAILILSYSMIYIAGVMLARHVCYMMPNQLVDVFTKSYNNYIRI